MPPKEPVDRWDAMVQQALAGLPATKVSWARSAPTVSRVQMEHPVLLATRALMDVTAATPRRERLAPRAAMENPVFLEARGLVVPPVAMVLLASPVWLVRQACRVVSVTKALWGPRGLLVSMAPMVFGGPMVSMVLLVALDNAVTWDFSATLARRATLALQDATLSRDTTVAPATRDAWVTLACRACKVLPASRGLRDFAAWMVRSCPTELLATLALVERMGSPARRERWAPRDRRRSRVTRASRGVWVWTVRTERPGTMALMDLEARRVLRVLTLSTGLAVPREPTVSTVILVMLELWDQRDSLVLVV